MDDTAHDISNLLLAAHLDDDRVDVCSPGLVQSTPDETAIATVLAWLRQKKKDVAWTITHKCAPSPKGHIVKGKGIWMPDPQEACTCFVKIYGYVDVCCNGLKKQKMIAYPYAWSKHCKTLQHCEYLVQRRLPFVTTLVEPIKMSIMASAIRHDKVLLLVNDPDPLIRLFFTDWCMGAFNTLV